MLPAKKLMSKTAYNICFFYIFQSITLTFATAFHIETDVGCSYDYVSVYSDGNTYKHGTLQYPNVLNYYHHWFSIFPKQESNGFYVFQYLSTFR